ncbi:peptide chain release factor N(5)-glutamine methyltransferase [Solilutibacter pythonis]|nr:peptide chain release factor N(5)-glutamine methyltransferase [Lysobacter pythonis]
MRVADRLQAAAARIGREDAEHLLLHVLGKSRGWLFAHGEDDMAAPQAAAFTALAQRRAAGEPVAYLTGRRGFWTLELAVTPATLIPRPETECLVELALERIAAEADARIADLGTGSGAIGLALAVERPRARIVATDSSAGALEVAVENARTQRILNIEFRRGAWFAPLIGERFDLIVSNPPYIEAGDPHLGEGDLRFEPASALAAGVDGLDDLRVIVREAPAHLAAGGWLLVEHGWHQGEAVRALFAAAGFGDIDTMRDLEQRDRVTLGRRY